MNKLWAVILPIHIGRIHPAELYEVMWEFDKYTRWFTDAVSAEMVRQVDREIRGIV